MAGVKEKPIMLFSTVEATTREEVLEVNPVKEVPEAPNKTVRHSSSSSRERRSVISSEESI